MRKTNFLKVSLYAAGIGIFLLFAAGEIQAGEGVIVTEGVVGDFDFTLEGSSKQISSKVQYLGGDKFFIEGKSIVGGETQAIACEVAVEMPFEWIEIDDPDPDPDPPPIHWDPEEEVVVPPLGWIVPFYGYQDDVFNPFADLLVREEGDNTVGDFDEGWVVTPSDAAEALTNPNLLYDLLRGYGNSETVAAETVEQYMQTMNALEEQLVRESLNMPTMVLDENDNEVPLLDANGQPVIQDYEITQEQVDTIVATMGPQVLQAFYLGDGTLDQGTAFIWPDGDVTIVEMGITADGVPTFGGDILAKHDLVSHEEISSWIEGKEGGITLTGNIAFEPYDINEISEKLGQLSVIEKINEAGDIEYVLVTANTEEEGETIFLGADHEAWQDEHDDWEDTVMDDHEDWQDEHDDWEDTVMDDHEDWQDEHDDWEDTVMDDHEDWQDEHDAWADSLFD